MKTPIILILIVLSSILRVNAQTFEWTKQITPGGSDWPEYVETARGHEWWIPTQPEER